MFSNYDWREYFVSEHVLIHTCFTICSCETGWTVACITIDMIDTSCIVLTRVIHTIIDVCLTKSTFNASCVSKVLKRTYFFSQRHMHGEYLILLSLFLKMLFINFEIGFIQIVRLKLCMDSIWFSLSHIHPM